MSLRINQLDVRCETKTKDNVFVTVVASIQYQAIREQVEDAFYRLADPQAQIRSYVFDGTRTELRFAFPCLPSFPTSIPPPRPLFPSSPVRVPRVLFVRSNAPKKALDDAFSSVPKMELDEVFISKNEIAQNVEKELEKAMHDYGYRIVQTLIVDVEPDERVKVAMNEINAAQRIRQATQEKAEAEKILQVKKAEGDAEAKYLAGVGVARQRQAIVDGLRESVMGFSSQVPGTTAKDVLDMVMLTQYFDTMRDIGANNKSSTIFIPHGPGNVGDISAQIRDGLTQSIVASKNV
ncbi:unnamed protein product [Closterium sp. Naga37s-1]|nr:unnamed protein product [Closterium sp. Naga37s-1]